jgi:hypothetical protein
MDTHSDTRADALTQPGYRPRTDEIRRTFEEEIATVYGTVVDTLDDGEHLFLRAVLPYSNDVTRGDPLRAGVALRVVGPEVLVHPYTFRQVCTNGAIRTHALESRRIGRTWSDGVLEPQFEIALAVRRLRQAVQACASIEAFCGSIDEARTASELEAGDELTSVSTLARLAHRMTWGSLPGILERFAAAPDPNRSAFGLMNAITSVARDTADPERRWHLETLGGAIPARAVRLARPAPAAVARLGA